MTFCTLELVTNDAYRWFSCNWRILPFFQVIRASFSGAELSHFCISLNHAYFVLFWIVCKCRQPLIACGAFDSSQIPSVIRNEVLERVRQENVSFGTNQPCPRVLTMHSGVLQTCLRVYRDKKRSPADLTIKRIFCQLLGLSGLPCKPHKINWKIKGSRMPQVRFSIPSVYRKLFSGFDLSLVLEKQLKILWKADKIFPDCLFMIRSYTVMTSRTAGVDTVVGVQINHNTMEDISSLTRTYFIIQTEE